MGKHSSILAAITTVLLGCMAPVEVDENAWTNQAGAEEKTMALVPVGPAPGGPFATILCPDDGNTATAEDHRREVSALLRNDELQGVDITDLQNDKVDRAGDTMSDSLVVNASTTNNDAIVATGDGSGFGVKGIGGANGGGGRFEGTGNGSMGVSAVGGPTDGSGIVATGGAPSGLAIEAYPGGAAPTAAAPKMGMYLEGFLRLASPNPNAGVDPGANGAVYAGSVARARGRIYLGGAPPYSFIGKPLNFNALATVPGLGTTRVTMVRPMADLNYEVQLSVHGAIGYAVSETNIAGRTTTQFEFTVFNTTTAVAGVGPADYVDITVFGEQ